MFIQESTTNRGLKMKKLIPTLLLCLIAAKASAVQVTLTDVERIENGKSALCVYTGHNITRTVEVPASQNCKAAIAFDTDD